MEDNKISQFKEQIIVESEIISYKKKGVKEEWN
jgi:hypothetical protein